MPQTTLSDNPLRSLAKQVGLAAGMEVTCTRDCEVLSEEFKAFDGRFPISVSTLRRFFGLIPSKSKFSKTTLNTLARYIGHPSYHAWEQHRLSVESGPHSPTVDTAADNKMVTEGWSPKELQEFSPGAWNEELAKEKVRAFIQRHQNPKNFKLTTREFGRLKQVVFHFYRKGSFDMELWLEFIKHAHLMQFVIEQFPPLDFLNSFGRPMMDTYLRSAKTPHQLAFGRGVIAAGLVAKGSPWTDVFSWLPNQCEINPSIHPLAQARNLGIHLLAATSGQKNAMESHEIRGVILHGLENDTTLWPRWANQNCYFAFNLAEWAVLSWDKEIIAAVQQNIDNFRQRQDWYNRDSTLDTLLDLRQVWNLIVLGQKAQAKELAETIAWSEFVTMETRTLSMWFHLAQYVLGIAPKEISMANFQHNSVLTGYQGLTDLILNNVLSRLTKP